MKRDKLFDKFCNYLMLLNLSTSEEVCHALNQVNHIVDSKFLRHGQSTNIAFPIVQEYPPTLLELALSQIYDHYDVCVDTTDEPFWQLTLRRK